MPGLLRAEAAGEDKAPKPQREVGHLPFQFGGPSHIDMFDMKPDAPEGIRGPHKPISSNVPGIQVCEAAAATAQGHGQGDADPLA